MMFEISQSEFQSFQDLLFNELGIRLNDSRATLVRSRLMKRLRRLGISSYGEYFAYATNERNGEEKSILIDLLTTHETRFFRERRHFDHLQSLIDTRGKEMPLRVWSAACSSGEEAYSAAVVCARSGLKDWRILASDVSRSIVMKAEKGVFENRRLTEIDEHDATRFFLRGVRGMRNYFAAGSELRGHMQFERINLVKLPTSLPVFDVVFLCNVLIYFDGMMRRTAVEDVMKHLAPGGFLYVGAAESLNGISEDLQWRGQSIYQKLK